VPDIPETCAGSLAAGETRPVGPRHYLMCPPAYFDVTYSINPWMDASKPVDQELALAQWAWLRDLYRNLGHQVSELTPVEGLPDMVFTANGATVVDGRVLLAKFRYRERAAEVRAHRDWFSANGFRHIYQATQVNEGEGDCLLAGGRMLCGTGFRTSRHARGEIREVFGRPVTSLTLVDPSFYHLDTALAVLTQEEIMYYPSAFSPGSQHVLRQLFPAAIVATAEDAEVFGLNAVCDGRHVVLPQGATHLVGRLRRRGFTPIGVDVSELIKAGGAVKCCTLEVRCLKSGPGFNCSTASVERPPRRSLTGAQERPGDRLPSVDVSHSQVHARPAGRPAHEPAPAAAFPCVR
jgi:N-dimethylarginine dimethylaminohydrolase